MTRLLPAINLLGLLLLLAGLVVAPVAAYHLATPVGWLVLAGYAVVGGRWLATQGQVPASDEA